MNTTCSARSLANALLQQASRGWEAEGHVIATTENYAAVRELVMALIPEGVGATVTPNECDTRGRPVTATDPEQRFYKSFVPAPGALPSRSRDPPLGGGAVGRRQRATALG